MTPSRPSILFISSSWPHDQTHGGQLRALHVGRALQQIGDVTLLVVNNDPVVESVRQKTAEEFRVVPSIHPQPAPNRGLVRKLRWAFDAHFLNVHGTVVSAGDRQHVLNYAREHDLVWTMNARTPSLLQIWRWPRTHLDVDDIPSTYHRALGGRASGCVARLKARAQQALLHRRESFFRERFTTVSVCSEADRTYLGGDAVHVIPNGFARPATEPPAHTSARAPRIGFIGLYSYAPNLDGVRWFLRNAWPAVQRAVPGVRFRMIGKETDGALRPRDPEVDALGWVADPAEEIATWSAMVVPIRFGGGTRIKLAEAFSRKCPVVATPFGAYGYNVEHDKQVLLAEDAPGFSAACIELLRNPPHARQLAETAWQEFLNRWTWDAISPKIWSAAEDCLRRSAALSTA